MRNLNIRSLAIAAALGLTVVLTGAASPAAAAPANLPYGPDTCKNGFVWREAAPGDNVCVTPATRSQAAYDNSQRFARRDVNGAYGSNSCKQGYVWREAFVGDVVCVTPARRSAVKYENSLAASRRVGG